MNQHIPRIVRYIIAALLVPLTVAVAMVPMPTVNPSDRWLFVAALAATALLASPLDALLPYRPKRLG